MENPWSALVDQIAEAVVRKLEEREKINAIAQEVLMLLEERWRVPRQPPTGDAASVSLNPHGGQRADGVYTQPQYPPAPVVVAPAVGACDCSTEVQDFQAAQMGEGKSDG